MPTGSIIDLYTTLLGWYMNNALWDLIVGTGVIFIPFIARVLQVHLKDAENERKSTKGFVRALEFNVYMMLAVMVFAAQPMVTLHTANMTYTHLDCKAVGSEEVAGIERQAEKISYGESGTRADSRARWFDATLNGREVQLPLFWYIWMRMSHALTFALSFELPCSPDFRALSDGLANIQINDPALRNEVYQFQRDCYKPSLAKYTQERGDNSHELLPAGLASPQIETQELSWIGSQIFLRVSGFYDFYRAEEPVEAFIWEEGRDASVQDGIYTGNAGFPMCDEWWDPASSGGITNQKGLRERLIDYVKSTDSYQEEWGDTLRYWSDNYLGTSTQYQKDNFLLRSTLLSEERFNNNLSRVVGDGGGILSNAADAFAILGLSFGSIKDEAMANIYRAAGPLIQALLIMVVVMFLPLFMTLTTFQVDKLMLLAVMVFSVIFWSYLFAFANYLDNFLLSSLVAADGDARASEEGLLAIIGNKLKEGADNDSVSLNTLAYVTRGAYVYLPMIFSAIMSLIGWQMSSVVTDLVSRQSGSAAASSMKGVEAAKMAGGKLKK